MMCLACEQDFGWFAYLESQGLAQLARCVPARAPFPLFADKPMSTQNEGSAPKSADDNPFSCDEPTAG
jgi:hypothetical protein